MLIIEGTYKTPTIHFDPEQGKLSITGRSIPEHPIKVYQPLIDAIEEYIKNPAPKTAVTIRLDYLNTHSIEVMMLILNLLAEAKDKSDITVYWQYEEEDEDMLFVGEDFQLHTDLKFVFQSFAEDEY
tara:strand:- start:40410 stop:40790 length:381 start_codon:yes stop_codon:yes gene_type:complete